MNTIPAGATHRGPEGDYFKFAPGGGLWRYWGGAFREAVMWRMSGYVQSHLHLGRFTPLDNLTVIEAWLEEN